MTSTCTINIQCVPTPEIAVKRGKAAQPSVPTAITDENAVPIQDENLATLVND